MYWPFHTIFIVLNIRTFLGGASPTRPTHLRRYPYLDHHMICNMSEDAETKAKRRRRIRESFPPPLNEIALRHVDSVQSISEDQRGILAKALQKKGLRYLVDCLVVIKTSGVSFEAEDALIDRLERSTMVQSHPRFAVRESLDSNSEDKRYLANLLIQCYPDMPLSSADALVSSEVMSACLHVLVTTRHALDDAKSDFVITALYALFEERSNAIKQIINSNPAFAKAMQRSRPDWNTKH